MCLKTIKIIWLFLTKSSPRCPKHKQLPDIIPVSSRSNRKDPKEWREITKINSKGKVTKYMVPPSGPSNPIHRGGAANPFVWSESRVTKAFSEPRALTEREKQALKRMKKRKEDIQKGE